MSEITIGDTSDYIFIDHQDKGTLVQPKNNIDHPLSDSLIDSSAFQRLCPHCKEKKPHDHFTQRGSLKWCRSCRSAYSKIRTEQRAEEKRTGLRVCKQCHEAKSLLTEFYYTSGGNRASICKLCSHLKRKLDRDKRRNLSKHSKVCATCGETKPLTEFYIIKNYFVRDCRVCFQLKRQTEYRIKKLETIKDEDYLEAGITSPKEIMNKIQELEKVVDQLNILVREVRAENLQLKEQVNTPEDVLKANLRLVMQREDIDKAVESVYRKIQSIINIGKVMEE